MKEVFVLNEEDFLKIAVKENGELVECIVEEHSTDPQIGEIYKGRIKNILPSINSIFIDIGLEKEAYMYYSDELKRVGVKKGKDILVEILKEPLGNKGAKVTYKPSIAGKYAVLTLGSEGIKLSKRITSLEARQRLTTLIKPPRDVEVLFRTDAENVEDEEVLKDLDALFKKKEDLERKLNYSTNLGKIDSNSLLVRFFSELDNIKTNIICDDKEKVELIEGFIKNKDNISIKYYDGDISLFDYYGIEKEILKLRHKKVNLPSGGYIVIDKTEAMYVIDVNSGKHIKARDFNKTIFETNMEAAKEIGRQIKLRNLSGIIVVDFIDMRDDKQRPIVMKTLKKSLESDKGNTKIYPFTELDLIQISRRRKGKSIYEYLEESCKKCKANGYILKLSYLENLIKNEILRAYRENSINDFYIELDESYKENVKEDLVGFLARIDGLDKEIYLNFIDNLEGYKLEPLIFASQKENYQSYKIKTI